MDVREGVVIATTGYQDLRQSYSGPECQPDHSFVVFIIKLHRFNEGSDRSRQRYCQRRNKTGNWYTGTDIIRVQVQVYRYRYNTGTGTGIQVQI